MLKAVVNLLARRGETGANEREEGVDGVERERRLREYIDTDDGGCYLGRGAECAGRHAGDYSGLAVKLGRNGKQGHVAGGGGHVSRDFALDHYDHETGLAPGFEEAADYGLRCVVG